MSWIVGVDVGGTFTDFYAVSAASGEVRVAKRPSTRDNPGRAVIEGLGELSEAGVPLRRVRRLAHGTTVATNAIIQRRGGKVVLVTTAGFRDLLEIGRQIRPHMYDLYRDQPPPLVPRERRLEVEERITSGGRVVRPLGDAAVRRRWSASARSTRTPPRYASSSRSRTRSTSRVSGTRSAPPGRGCGYRSPRRSARVPGVRALLHHRPQRMAPARHGRVHGEPRGGACRTRAPRPHRNQPVERRSHVAGPCPHPSRANRLSGPAAGVVGAIDAGERSGPRDLITSTWGARARTSPWSATSRRTSPSNAPSPVSQSGSRASTCRRWGPGAAPSPGSTATACSRSDRRARGPNPVRPATAGAAPSRPSPTPTCSSAGSRAGGSSAGA